LEKHFGKHTQKFTEPWPLGRDGDGDTRQDIRTGPGESDRDVDSGSAGKESHHHIVPLPFFGPPQGAVYLSLDRQNERCNKIFKHSHLGGGIGKKRHR